MCTTRDEHFSLTDHKQTKGQTHIVIIVQTQGSCKIIVHTQGPCMTHIVIIVQTLGLCIYVNICHLLQNELSGDEMNMHKAKTQISLGIIESVGRERGCFVYLVLVCITCKQNGMGSFLLVGRSLWNVLSSVSRIACMGCYILQ